MTTTIQPHCHICGAAPLQIIPEYAKFHRVTSDCKPWPPGGGLGVCLKCGCAQAVIDAAWQREIEQIYEEYSPYHQGGGVEQNVFDPASGAASTRSQRLVQCLATVAALPEQARLLDVGCGNGALLRAFGAAFKHWTMAGIEVHEHLRPVIEGIDRVEKLYTYPLSQVPGQFALVSLVHVLEHVASPMELLGQIWDKLETGGHLLVQVPDCEQNPFLFTIADHASHFFLPVLKRVIESAGFEVVVATNEWVAKELTVVARKAGGARQPFAPSGASAKEAAIARRNLTWLKNVVENARALSVKKPFGIFGTSIAATWLYGELGGAIDFYVDEDPNRPGKIFFDRPVHAPGKIPAGAGVFIALAPTIAGGIARRMEQLALPASFYVPAPL